MKGENKSMWKDYSSGYIKNNRSSSISVMLAAFISALLLSVLCGEFYNLWKYEVERIKLEDGAWQSQIAGEFDTESIEAIRKFADIKEAAISEREPDGKTVIEFYFNDYRAALIDTPQIAEMLGVTPEAVTYNFALLAMYFIRSPSDTAPRMVFPLFMLIMAVASFSLIIIIHNSFAVSMNARLHQFGIFSSVGATPKQIRTCLLQEAAVLSAVPVFVGTLLGIAISMMFTLLSNLLGGDTPGRHKAVFGYHPLVLLLTLLVTVITIWISAWLPARKLSKLSPLEAIKNTGELQLKRRKNSPVLALLFGIEGELAGNALKAQRKALRTASLSLVASVLAFTLMQCFFTLSGISTRETYFERYQDAWDIMVTVKNLDVDFFDRTQEIQELSGVRSAVVYQKGKAKTIITEDEISGEAKSLGVFIQENNPSAFGNYVMGTDGGWLVNAPIIILDDASFLDYCSQLGIAPDLHGAVIYNRVRDVTNPDFRHPVYMPYINGKSAASVLQCAADMKAEASGGTSVEIPVLSYTEQIPVLREEYATIDYYELVHFIPVSLWKEIKGLIGGTEEDTYIRILGRENATLEELDALQREIDGILGGDYTIESENRIQEKVINEKQLQGMNVVFSSFCVLLAIIGIGNVFSNTLGFVRQRKREFARYMSVGMTPGEIRKMFCTEALVIAGRPVLITVPLAVIAVGYMLKASYVEAGVFLAEMPLLPIGGFMLAIWGIVAVAYYLGWRSVRGINLAGVLRDDTML